MSRRSSRRCASARPPPRRGTRRRRKAPATPATDFQLSFSRGRADLVFARPPANVLDIAVLERLTRALTPPPADCRMLVLSGAPHFCAGVEIADHIPEKAVAMLAAIHGFLRALLEFPALTIAKIRGACLGGGAEIALACDFTFAADDAQAGYPEITLSCFPPAAAVLLPPAVGSVRAMDLVCSGRTISGREAAGIGIFTRAVAPVRLDAEVERYLAQILSRSSPALAAVRDLVRLPKRKVFDAGIAESERRYREVARAPELAQAVECFLNRKS